MIGVPLLSRVTYRDLAKVSQGRLRDSVADRDLLPLQYIKTGHFYLDHGTLLVWVTREVRTTVVNQSPCLQLLNLVAGPVTVSLTFHSRRVYDGSGQ